MILERVVDRGHKVQFRSREANQVAHIMAKVALGVSSSRSIY